MFTATQSSRRAFLKTAALGTAALAFPTGAALLDGQVGLPDDFLAAVARGDLATVRRLLAADASLLRRTDAQGRTAYALAYLNGQPAIGAYLLGQGYTSDLHEAALAQDWDRFAALSDEQPMQVNADHPLGGTALYAAALGGAGTQVWRVYAVAGQPNHIPRQRLGATPLQAALRYRDLPVAELTAASLLSNAADPNPPPNAEPPPLHLAAGRGSAALVEMLIHYGADVAARDATGQQATEYAHRGGHPAIVDLLARADEIPRLHNAHRASRNVGGAPYAAPDLGSLPPMAQGRLVGAAHRDLAAVRQAVTETPGLAHAVATTGERAVEAGAHMGNRPIVEYLLEQGAPYSLPTAVMRDDQPTVRAMLDADPRRIHERGAHGFALLWYPIIGQTDLSMMELLLDRGGDVEQQHFLGTTALHWASRGTSADMVALLLTRGADPNRAGRKFGEQPLTPLQIATSAGRTAIAQLLRDHGAR